MNKSEYIPRPSDTSNISLPEGMETLVEALARNVHEVWAAGRLEDGWVLGEERNDALKQHPCLVPYEELSEEEKDYSIIGTFTADTITGTCVYCNHCQPCPAGIDIGLVNKYYDLALAGDTIAANHYDKLSIKADACLQCGHCEDRCPFSVKQESRMEEIAKYFD